MSATKSIWWAQGFTDSCRTGYALDSGSHHRLGLRLPVAHFRNVRRERVCPSGAARRLGARKTVTVGLIGRRTPPTHTAGAVPGHCCEPRSAGNHQILGLPESSAYPVLSITIAPAIWSYGPQTRSRTFARGREGRPPAPRWGLRAIHKADAGPRQTTPATRSALNALVPN